MIWKKDGYIISTQKEHVDIDILYRMLKRSYWAKSRSRKEVETSIANSICFSLLRDKQQIGFVRVITDQMAYAIILDMILEKDFRGQGLGRWMMHCLGEHHEIKDLRQVLWTSDAERFYRKQGFADMSNLKFMARNWNM